VRSTNAESAGSADGIAAAILRSLRSGGLTRDALAARLERRVALPEEVRGALLDALDPVESPRSGVRERDAARAKAVARLRRQFLVQQYKVN
jgi:hypothetical protein